MAEKRFIDADILIQAFQEEFNKEGAKADDMAMRGIADASVKYSHGQFCYLNAIERVKDAPAADVVEVVRCKDCKHFKEGDHVFLRTPDTCWYFSGYDDVEVKPDGFCSYGERKEQT